MNKLLENRAFKLGFLVGILFFVFANVYASLPEREISICFDCYVTYGFPFAMYESGSILHLKEFIWVGVVANVSATIFFSIILGLIFKYVWSKISSRRVNLH